ncbi:hypothetical protein Asp14428_75250 [Actinoplanes sp. NBRC 14428]|nr:hypothetical protein Asp14428_75250 [Actinoplanes sp. NBRC 14428]
MTRRMRIDDLVALAVPAEPALSPDGSRVAYVLRTQDAAADRTVSELWIVPTGGGSTRRLTAGPADTTPVWSPDGTRLAFLREGRLAVLPMDGGEVRVLPGLPALSGPPAWSPAGDRLAFTALVEEEEAPHAPLVADGLDYQADGAGLRGPARRQVHVADLGTGECTVLTDGPHDAGPPVWSPDGADVAFVRAVGEDSDLRFRSAVHLLAAGDRRASPRVAGPDGVARTAGFTADGAALLVVGWPGDPVGHARLLRVPLDGGEPADLAGALDRNVMPGGPAYPGGLPQEHDGRVLFCVRDKGCTHLWSVAADGTDARPLAGGAGRVVDGLSVRAGLAAFVLSTPDSFGEIAVLDLATGDERVLTGHGGGFDLFPARSAPSPSPTAAPCRDG